MTTHRKNILSILFIVLIGIVLYGSTMKGSLGNASSSEEYSALTKPGEVFESSHERSPFAMLLAMRENKTVELNEELARFSSPDVAYINQKFYSFFPPGIPVLIWPLYVLGSQYDLGVVAGYATIPIISIGVLVLLFAISREIFRMPIFASMLSALIFAFATTSWSYAITIYQHIPITFCMLLAFYAAWKFKNAGVKISWFWGLASGVAYAVSVFIDYPAALLLAPALSYLILNAFSFVKTTIGIKRILGILFPVQQAVPAAAGARLASLLMKAVAL